MRKQNPQYAVNRRWLALSSDVAWRQSIKTRSGDHLYASVRFCIKETVKTHTPPCFYKNRLNVSVNIGFLKILGGVFLRHTEAKN